MTDPTPPAARDVRVVVVDDHAVVRIGRAPLLQELDGVGRRAGRHGGRRGRRRGADPLAEPTERERDAGIGVRPPD